jgi:hypothetical protein
MATGFYPAYNTDGSGSEMTAIGSGYVHTLTATQLEIGSTASDYSPTTTAAASNPNAGRYSWAFDAAAQQRLHLASAPFQSNDDFWIVAPCRVDSSGATQGLFGVSTNVNTGELIMLAFNNGKAQLYIATGGVTRQALSTLTYNFTPIVMAARKVGTDCYLNVNGVEVGTFNTVGLPASAFTVSHIGTYMSSAGYFGGALGQVQACKGAITAEQLLIEMRYAAAQFPNGPQF